MELRLAVAISLLVVVILVAPLVPVAHPAGSCSDFGPFTQFLGGTEKLLIFLVVASVTIHHLGPIQQFLLAIIEFAGRTTRRLIALGILLLFLLALLYLADNLIGHIIELRSAVFRCLAAITLIALFLGVVSFVAWWRQTLCRQWNRVVGAGSLFGVDAETAGVPVV